MHKWPEYLCGVLWIAMFWMFIPYFFEHCFWDSLRAKVLASVINSAITPSPLIVPLYLALKAR